jgi:HlyD family secretion protein
MTTTEKPIRKKKKRLSGWWILLIIAVLLAGFFTANSYIKRQQAEQTISQLKTVPYQRDTLVSTISGSGTVRARQSAVLVWQSSAYVGEVLVEVGDEVKANTPLMRLDKNRLPVDILQAELNKLDVETKLGNLESDTDLQRAQLQSDIATVEKNIANLQDQRDALTLRTCSDSRLTNLQKQLDDALADYENWPTQVRWMAVENARQNLAYCDPQSIADETNTLDKQIALQEEILTGHQENLEKIKDGPDPEVKERLQAQLDLANKQLSQQEILAPFAGTITELSMQVGDVVSPGSRAVQMADLSELYLDVPVSEVDIPYIQVGQSAELIFDAFFEDSYQGIVSEIASVPSMAGGVVNYNVTILMQSGMDKVKPGMTVGVNILTETRENTYVVPAESVFTREGKTYVYVRRDGRPEMVEVKIGAYSSQSIEILEADIKDGEAVYISPPVSLIESFMRMGGGHGR